MTVSIRPGPLAFRLRQSGRVRRHRRRPEWRQFAASCTVASRCRAECLLIRASTSVSHAYGSRPSRRAVWISVYITAARSLPRTDAANNQAFLPSAMPLCACYATLLVKQIRP
jgi:hypothetical protein